MKAIEFPLSEIKEWIIHTQLLEALCLMIRARDIIFELTDKDKKPYEIEVIEDDLDFVHNALNKESGRLGEIIMHIMRLRVEEYINEEGKEISKK